MIHWFQAYNGVEVEREKFPTSMEPTIKVKQDKIIDKEILVFSGSDKCYIKKNKTVHRIENNV